MKKQIVTLIILIIIGLGAWYIFKATRPQPMIEDTTGTTTETETGTTNKNPITANNLKALSGTYKLSKFSGIGFSSEAPYTLSFTGNKLSAKFCNQMSGSYTISDGGKLTAPQLMSTVMACETPEGLMDAETAFGKILAEGAAISFQESDLILEGDNGERFIFNKQ